MQTKLLLPRGFGPAQPLFPTSTSPACGVPGGGGEEAETGGATSSHLPFKEAPSSPFKEAPPRRAGQALCMKLLGLCGLTQPTFNCFQAAGHFPTQSCTRPAQCPQPRWTKQRVPTAEASPAWPLCAPAPGDLALSKQVQGLHVSGEAEAAPAALCVPRWNHSLPFRPHLSRHRHHLAKAAGLTPGLVGDLPAFGRHRGPRWPAGLPHLLF